MNIKVLKNPIIFIIGIVLCTMLFSLDASAQARSANRNSAASRSGGRSGTRAKSDTTNVIPRGLTTWAVDERFGEVTPTVPDTVSHLFQTSNFTEGPHYEYNITGNLGSPRVSRIYSGQQDYMMGNQFIFGRPYDYVLGSVNDCVFTNTKSPITNLTYMTQGNKTNGDDRFRALFASNINKVAGIGFKVDYLYGRGYYSHQQQSSLGAKLYGSYRGDRYQMHAAYILDRTKNAENGGLEDENYVTHPEYFSTKFSAADMPMRLSDAFNRLKVNTFFLTHRYGLGYYRYLDKEGNVLHSTQKEKKDNSKGETKGKPAVSDIPEVMELPTQDSLAVALTDSIPSAVGVPVAEEEHFMVDSTMIRQFIPVAAFIHTLRADHNRRYYIDNSSARDYYLYNFLEGDSINDQTRYLSVENTFAIEMSEGFKKWVKTGMRLFGKHQLTSFSLPDEQRIMQNTTYNYFTVGAQLMREQGKVFHYNVLGEIRTTGAEWGEFNVEGYVNFNVPIRRDSVNLRVDGFVRNEEASYYYRHYHASNAWWDNDLSKVFRTRLEGELSWRKTHLRVGVETIQNHTFFQEIQDGSIDEGALASRMYGIGVAQADKNVQLLTATLKQDFKFGPLNWENELTYQKTSDDKVLPLPAFTGWSNLFLGFKIAKVLRTELGADVHYFTKYYAPAYSPIIGQYVVQDENYRTKVGNYPWVNVYANFHLKSCRFYVMFSHVNCSTGNYFYTPHYPTNQRVFRVGISWNFFN